MKIIAGRFRGRSLKVPGDAAVRPTGSRTREAIFNILANGQPARRLNGAVVLDVFAGTGSLGFEALSRGAACTVFVDRSAGPLALVRINADRLGVSDVCITLKRDAACLGVPPPATVPADLAFLDPPYDANLMEPALLGLARNCWLSDGAIVVCESSARTEIGQIGGYRMVERRVYGAAGISFLRFTKTG